MPVPSARVRIANGAPERPERGLVLYWCIGARRATHNFALDVAIEHARRLGRPLLVLEPLRVDHPWASARMHTFVLEGMRDNASAFAAAGIAYHPYVEPTPGAGRGLLAALAAHACVVITDDVPGFFLPRAVAAAAARLDVRILGVDGNGLIPLAASTQVFASALAYRRFAQRVLPEHLRATPRAAPPPTRGPAAALPDEVARRWPAARLDDVEALVRALPVDHAVARAPLRGGGAAGAARLERFVAAALDRYADDKNHPDLDGASGLSPYLHFGHLSAYQVFLAVAARAGFSPTRAARTANGARVGWWGVGPGAEAFLDQLVTWRELALHNAAHDARVEHYDSIPAWARASLAAHADDPRPTLYTLEQLAAARTHDEVWNAAQRQLSSTGVLHTYLRMLWGKKVIEWSRAPEDAYARLVELNNRYALDGRDANSLAGIQWCFGRYDRPWGPRRPIFGVVRYLSSDNTRRKLQLRRHLERFAATPLSGVRGAP